MFTGESNILITCEHAVNKVPTNLQELFSNHFGVLNTHEAIDYGALEIATALHENLRCPLYTALVSRLVVDCNRSQTHPKCFSRFTSTMNKEQRNTLLQTYYHTYRNPVISEIKKQVESTPNPVIHLSIHSFTAILNDHIRQTDIGLLYDPGRQGEKKFVKEWQKALKKEAPHLRVRLNYPYRGQSDGFSTSLRKQFNDSQYIGIELETNQAITMDPNKLRKLIHFVIQSLKQHPTCHDLFAASIIDPADKPRDVDLS